MKMPKTLTGEAAKFWKDNAPGMLADGRLTEETLSGFVVLCMTWSQYLDSVETGNNTIQTVCLAKQVQQLLNSYGMTPASRKRLKFERQETITDVLTRKMGLPPINHGRNP